jgi:chemotaxis protein methyltransferase CheR
MSAAPREFPLTDRDFRFLAEVIGQHTGIVLKEHKRDLVYGRLAKRLRQLGLQSFEQYCHLLQGEAGEAELPHVVNAITTNHTAFFREPHHFQHLEQVLRQMNRPRLRLWSAGSSIGAEAYSMGMCVLDALPPARRGDVKILATDIDTAVLAKGRAGEYPAALLDSIPAAKRAKYVSEEADGHLQMGPALRDLVTFLPLNLLGEWPMRGPFDIIFCRNVVIYFDKPTQRRLFDRFADLLQPDGWLYIGHSESLFNVTDRFRPAGRTIYQLA